MKPIILALSTIVVLSQGAIVPSVKAQSDSVCTFESRKTSMRSDCSIRQLGWLNDFVGESYKIDWADGVQTQIEITWVSGIGNRFVSGFAIVDGEPAEFIFSTDKRSRCFTIKSNQNRICQLRSPVRYCNPDLMQC